MLKDRVLFTLKFFDLQQTPLSISELRDFLFNEPELLKESIDTKFEIQKDLNIPGPVSQDQILEVLQNELGSVVTQHQGYYCLTGRSEIIEQRLQNEIYRNNREKIISRFLPFLKFVPFVRGAAVGGSQTLGSSKSTSDIDLFIILDPKYLWLGRILVTGYFQLTGHRRHGDKIQNRFCLNHYLAGPITVKDERDPYNAMEYLRLRPDIYPQLIGEFLDRNLFWIRKFFPHGQIPKFQNQKQSRLQLTFEKLFTNPFGLWLNKKLGHWQLRRIHRGEPAVADQTELSFHSKPRKFDFLSRVFGQ